MFEEKTEKIFSGFLDKLYLFNYYQKTSLIYLVIDIFLRYLPVKGQGARE